MKFICTTEYLQNATTIVERFTGKHVTLPILGYIKITTGSGHILLSATNLEMGVEYSIPGKVNKPGTVTLPARLLTQSLHVIEGETISIELVKQNIVLTTPSSTVTLLGLNPDDFPTTPAIQNEYTFTIDAAAFIPSIEQVIPAVATSDLKPELAGVLFGHTPASLTIAATDSFRLAEKTIRYAKPQKDTVECIVPRPVIQELTRIIPPDNDIAVLLGEHQVMFEWGPVKILSRLIDGSYPPYQNLFPKVFETTITAPRGDLEKRVRLAAVFSSRLSDVTLEYSQGELTVRAESGESGGTTTRLAVKASGKSGAVMFNYRYLLDGLEAAHGDTVVLRMNGSTGPTLIENPADPSFRYLIMPIRSV